MLDTTKAHTLLHDFFSDGVKREYKRKSLIVSYSAPADSIFYIVEGAVKIISHDANGQERIHSLYGPGEVFPVSWIFCDTKFQVEFVAFSNVTILKKSLKETNAFFEREPYSLVSLVRQQADTFDRIVNLNMRSAHQRVAYRVLILCFKFGNKVGNHYLIDLPITLQELADMVRLTRERTGLVIADLESSGCLVMGRRNIIVYDEQLKKHADYNKIG